MMRVLVLAFALSACASTAVQPPQKPPAMMSATPEEIDAGRQIVMTRCASCHAIAPDSASRHPEAPPLARLSEEYPVTALEEAFAEGVIVGHPDMPEFSLTPEQIRALLGYLESIQVNRGV